MPETCLREPHPCPPHSPKPRSAAFPLACCRPVCWEGVGVNRASGCLGARVHLLVGPELLVLFPTKPFIVVAFALKQLLKVRFAVKFTMQCSITAQTEFGVAVFATEARVVENKLVCHQPLHRIHSLLAGCTGLLHLSPQAKGLGALHGVAATAAFGFMRRGGLGGSCSLEHGSSGCLAAWVETAAPGGFCKGKSVSGAP